MRSVPALAAGAVVLALSGCAAPVDGFVVLQRVGEHVHATVQVCHGNSVDGVTLRENGGTFHDEWDFDEPVVESGSIDIGVFDDAVTLLDTGHSYVLGTSSSEDGIQGLEFESEDLAALANGEYLTATGALDEDGFAALVAEGC